MQNDNEKIEVCNPEGELNYSGEDLYIPDGELNNFDAEENSDDISKAPAIVSVENSDANASEKLVEYIISNIKKRL